MIEGKRCAVFCVCLCLRCMHLTPLAPHPLRSPLKAQLQAELASATDAEAEGIKAEFDAREKAFEHGAHHLQCRPCARALCSPLHSPASLLPGRRPRPRPARRAHDDRVQARRRSPLHPLPAALPAWPLLTPRPLYRFHDAATVRLAPPRPASPRPLLTHPSLPPVDFLSK